VWSLRTIPDINNDGQTDIAGLFGFSGEIFALSGANGQQLWVNNLGLSNNGTVEIADDKDKNGFPDLIFSGSQAAFRIDSKTNQIFWTKGLFSSYIRDAGFLGDVSGDTLGELLFATQQPGKVFVLDGQDGGILFEYTFGTSISQRADRVSALQSIDGNTTNEFAAVCRDGRIKCFSGGPGQIIGISQNNGTIPVKFYLYQNYPNPFNPSTSIKFDIPKSNSSQAGAKVKLTVYDILGREVDVIVNDELPPGEYSVDWNASAYASGVYFYELDVSQTGSSRGVYKDIKKMMVVK
jgi:hypothetical protein